MSINPGLVDKLNGSAKVQVADANDIIINPATEETLEALPTTLNDEALWLLRRLVKLSESNGTVDPQNRQRVLVEGTANVLPSSYYAGINQFNIPNSTVFAPLNNASVTYVQPVQTGPVDPRWQIMDQARLNHQQCVRNNLVFTS